MNYIVPKVGPVHLAAAGQADQGKCGASTVRGVIATLIPPGRTVCVNCRNAASRTGAIKTQTSDSCPECYCSASDFEILTDINQIAVPAEALTERHCWIRICEVRGRSFSMVDPASWSELCRKRGYLFRRFNRY